MVRGGSDKFIGSDLEQRLKDRGIKTVIVTGTSAQGAVAGATERSSVVTKPWCRSMECQRKTRTTNNTPPGTSIKAALPV